MRRNGVLILSLGLVLFSLGLAFYTQQQKQQEIAQVTAEKVDLQSMLGEIQAELEALKNEDPRKTNIEIQAKIRTIESAYDRLARTFELIQDMKDEGLKIDTIERDFAAAIRLLGDLKYDEATKKLDEVNSSITKVRAEQQAAAEKARLAEIAKAQSTAQQQVSIENVTPVQQPPDSGYRRQVVETSKGKFTVSLVAADLSSTRVIVDTASDGTCANDCPVLSLAEYVARSGAYAGVNGTYFCPASYPSCAGKTNSFDLLVMNKNKVYFNSDNNVYSNNPGVIFGGGYIRFVTAVSQWGRDTGIDSMLSNYPLLVFNSQQVYDAAGDEKMAARGGRSFVANQGNRVFIGVVHSATVAESATVLKTLGMENALNLDNGGSTALWSGGYKVGPGRNLPNVILFTNR